MKSLRQILMIALLTGSLPARMWAQSTGDSMPPMQKIIIPPLPELLEAAIEHNAAVQFRQLDIVAKEAGLQSEKNYWTRNLGLQAETRYGTFDNYSLNNDGVASNIFTTNTRQINYSVGVYLKFPLVDVIDRKNQIKRATAELEQSRRLAEGQEEEVKERVIRQYQDVILKQELLNIQSIALGNARVNVDMIDKEFRNGHIPVSEFVRISDIVSRVESDYEKAKSEFITAKLLLEAMTGLAFTEKAKI